MPDNEHNLHDLRVRKALIIERSKLFKKNPPFSAEFTEADLAWLIEMGITTKEK